MGNDRFNADEHRDTERERETSTLTSAPAVTNKTGVNTKRRLEPGSNVFT